MYILKKNKFRIKYQLRYHNKGFNVKYSYSMIRYGQILNYHYYWTTAKNTIVLVAKVPV